MNTAIKWFPDRRGLTTGIGTMAFAGGSALFIPYVRSNATITGYDDVLRTMGLAMGAVIILSALVLRDPPSDWRLTSEATSSQTPGAADGSYTWKEMLGTWQFWLMYGMFIAVSGAGLMLTAKIVSFADNFGLSSVVATASATVLPIAAGAGRLVLGDLSDRVDREKAMAISFVLCGVGVLLVVWAAQAGQSIVFIVAVAIAVFFWSPQYTLFPSVIGDYYGEDYSSANYALLYSGKMWGGIFGGVVTAWLVTQTNWKVTFIVGGIGAILAGASALLLSSPD